MNKVLIAIVLALAASGAHAYDALANVVAVSPVTETVNRPTQQCWTETQQIIQTAPPQRSAAGAIIGGIAGGLLGSTIGDRQPKCKRHDDHQSGPGAALPPSRQFGDCHHRLHGDLRVRWPAVFHPASLQSG
jgi:hypothetical protein